jgi:UDP-N-acetylmuramate--alanine ligase
MAGIARYLRADGHQVTGSDERTTGHGPARLVGSIDRVIYSDAVTPSSAGYEELQAARDRGIPTLRRIEFIAERMQGRLSVAVAGAHGKSTTTALIGWGLADAGSDPSVFVGADVSAFYGSARYGQGRVVVVEACEWNRQFLSLSPTVLALTSIDREHLDTYPGGVDEITAAFRIAADRVRPGGLIVANGDDPLVQRALTGVRARVISVGSAASNDVRIRVAEPTAARQLGVGTTDTAGTARYVTSPLVGTHHAVNVTIAVTVLSHLGLSFDLIAQGLSRFPGLKRRFERYRDTPSLTVVDDYAHHPAELAATVGAVHQWYPGRRLIVAFQPHTSQRTTDTFDEFVTALLGADETVILETYEPVGRFRDDHAKTSADLVAALIQRGQQSVVAADNATADARLVDRLQSGDVLLTAGATDVWKLAAQLVRRPFPSRG